MTWDLLENMFYAAPELWYGIGGVFLALLVILGVMMLLHLKTKQKLYFLRRDRERYAETLYASHDGYFAFIYPDYRVNDPQENITERCSRRLAVILNLAGGTKSSFQEVLKNFYKDDAKKIEKYVELLKKDGTAFEDYFELKNLNKFVRLEGVRINGADGSIYCDMIWFRDISAATGRIKLLEEQKSQTDAKYWQQRELLDNLPWAVWLRDGNNRLIYCNKKYCELVGEKSADEVIEKQLEICDTQGLNLSKNYDALSQNQNIKTRSGVVFDGNHMAAEVCFTPFYTEQNFDKIHLACCLNDISELDEMQRTQKQHQEAQLLILGKLGTAFAVFNQKMKLDFYNQAFVDAWGLNKKDIANDVSYTEFLDAIRENRMLPEVPDYKAFKKDELKVFNHLMEPLSDLLHLPCGKTYRRTRAPYLLGGVIFAYEDISDRLAATSAYNALYNVQQEMLNNLPLGVVVLGENGRVSFFNETYLKMWQSTREFLISEPNLDELLDSQRGFFDDDQDWVDLKKGIAENILNVAAKTFVLQRKNHENIQVNVAHLSDGTIMLVYEMQNNRAKDLTTN